MKKLLLLLFALPFVAMGQTSEPQSREELRLIEKIFYDRGVYIASDEERDKLKDLIFEMRADSTLRIHIIGYSDKWGGKEVNDRFSYVRAMYIADWMRSCRVPREQIAFVGEGVDSLATNDADARRVDISQIIEVPIEPTKEVEDSIVKAEAEAEAARVAAVKAEAARVAAEKAQAERVTAEKAKAAAAERAEQARLAEEQAAEDAKFNWKNFDLRTNLLYWLGGLMNIGTEYRQPNGDFGYLLNGGYSLFSDTTWNHNLGGWFVAPEVRYYLPCNDQWFVGAQFLAAAYNYKLSDTGYQGSVIGGGVVGGYRLTLSDNFDMDFTLGVGYGHLKYDTYYHDEATNTNPYIKQGVTKNSILPIQAGVNLSYKF